jgi:hypothetical protein
VARFCQPQSTAVMHTLPQDVLGASSLHLPCLLSKFNEKRRQACCHSLQKMLRKYWKLLSCHMQVNRYAVLVTDVPVSPYVPPVYAATAGKASEHAQPSAHHHHHHHFDVEEIAEDDQIYGDEVGTRLMCCWVGCNAGCMTHRTCKNTCHQTRSAISRSRATIALPLHQQLKVWNLPNPLCDRQRTTACCMGLTARTESACWQQTAWRAALQGRQTLVGSERCLTLCVQRSVRCSPAMALSRGSLSSRPSSLVWVPVAARACGCGRSPA